jgi:hypothetical protein
MGALSATFRTKTIVAVADATATVVVDAIANRGALQDLDARERQRTATAPRSASKNNAPSGIGLRSLAMRRPTPRGLDS